MAVFDREMRYIIASRQYLTDQGLPSDTPLAGRLHYDVFPDIPQKWRDVHAQVLREGVELSHQADSYVQPDGETAWIRWRAGPWRNDQGEIGGLVLYTEIVTDQVVGRLQLEAAEARYRAVFDAAATGVALVSPKGRFLEINDKFCAICRRTREDLLALTFQDITHPEDLDDDVKLVRQVLAGQIANYSLEKRYLGPKAEVIWIELTVALVRTAAGEPDYFVSIIEDIGARKTAEAQQQRYQAQLRLMINELNHRVKNTLATVQSMAAQTLRSASDTESAYGAFEARLLGLSEVHDVLTRERWHGAALQEVARRALRPFGAAAATEQVRVGGPQVWLAPGQALALALVFHELATNAVKYGALSTDSGRVDLAWTFDPATEALRLTWTESGGPTVSPPTRSGFGTRLIERGLASELQGRAQLHYAPGGVSCVMEARLPARPDMFSPPDPVAEPR